MPRIPQVDQEGCLQTVSGVILASPVFWESLLSSSLCTLLISDLDSAISSLSQDSFQREMVLRKSNMDLGMLTATGTSLFPELFRGQSCKDVFLKS